MGIKPLSQPRLEEVLERLGFVDRPNADLEGLRAIYAAWCLNVPFDNLRKLVALHFSMPELPGIEPVDFFAAWQLTGAGGTCWPSNNGLHALLVGLGFDARIHAASMRDLDVVNHGTTLVCLDGHRWLVDSSMLSGRPMPLDEGVAASTDHAGYVVTATPDAGGWLLRFPTPDPAAPMVCRLHGEMEVIATQEAYERTRTVSVFNTDLSCHSADAEGAWLIRGSQVVRIDRDGTTVTHASDEEVDRLLVEEVGHSPQLVAEVRGVLAVEAGER